MIFHQTTFPSLNQFYDVRFQVLPKWLIAHPNAIQTGNEILDSVLTVICSTSILVGGLIGCFLDNTIPGTTTLLKQNDVTHESYK